MQYVTAKEAQQRLAALLDTAQREPVTIRSHGQDVAVILSPDEYKRIRQWNLEQLDRICEQASRQAQENGLTEEILAEILAQDS